jgi:hypothetical protein
VPATPSGVEAIDDPKKPLQQLARRMSRSFDAYHERLAEEISISKLLGVPAFRRWWTDTADALASVGWQRAKPRS